MPGLLGFFHTSNTGDAASILGSMSQALEPADRYVRDIYASDHVGLGRVTTGILNPETQPVWNESGTVCIFLEGELFNARELAGTFKAVDWSGDPKNHARLVLELYELEGTRCFSQFNGAFVAAILDVQRGRLLLANDRMGLYPVYIFEGPSDFAFASGVRALLEFPGVSKNVDQIAIAEFLTFDHVLGDRTFLQDVRRLDQGTILTYENGTLTRERYWKPTFPRHYERYRDSDIVERFIELMKQAVQRQACDSIPGGLLLSGGMDSRMLLGFMAQSPERTDDLLTFSWGIPGCDDARYAAESARLAGARHHFFELKSDWLASMAEESVRICDGMGNVVNMHALATVDRQVEHAQVLFKGFLGDAMFGFGIRPRYWAKYSAEDRVQTHLDAYRDYDVLTFDLPVHEQVFTETFNSRIAGGIIADYQAVMDASRQEDLADQRIFIDLTQRVPRMTLNGVEAIRSQAAVRLPFADNDLIEFSLGLVPGLRLGRNVMVQAFIRALPEYAQIPLASTGLPLTACAREVVLRAAKLVRWHLRARGLGWMAGPERRPYKDYDAWFRTVLRDQVEEVLLSERSLARGFLKPELLRKTVEDHMRGTNQAVKLGALLSVELWHRMYLD